MQSLSQQLGFNNISYNGPEHPFINASDSSPSLDSSPYKLGYDLFEECYCDVVSTLIVADVFRKLGIFRLDDVFIGIAIGLRHLRLLGIVKDLCSGTWAASNEIDPILVLEYIIRASNIRRFLDYNKEILGINDLSQFNKELINLANRYERQLDDPLIFSISEKITNLREKEPRIEEKKYSPEISLKQIGLLTGFFDE